MGLIPKNFKSQFFFRFYQRCTCITVYVGKNCNILSFLTIFIKFYTITVKTSKRMITVILHFRFKMWFKKSSLKTTDLLRKQE